MVHPTYMWPKQFLFVQCSPGMTKGWTLMLKCSQRKASKLVTELKACPASSYCCYQTRIAKGRSVYEIKIKTEASTLMITLI